MNKRDLLERIEAELKREFETLTQAAQAAHEAATHEESRSEDQHDTRGLEASYLAGAQAARAAELERQIQLFQAIPRDSLPQGSRISSGALVTLASEGRRTTCILVPTGGGLTVSLGETRVQVITPASPLGEGLLGLRAGEEIEVELGPPQNLSRIYKILSVE